MSRGAWKYVMGVMLNQNGNSMSGISRLSNSRFNETLSCSPCDNDTSGKILLTTRYDFPNLKFYDTYAYSKVKEQYQRRILGDATGEMGSFSNKQYLTQTRQIGSWYADCGWFVLSNSPWFTRGGDFYSGTDSGIFCFGNDNGRVVDNNSFRIVLII